MVVAASTRMLVPCEEGKPEPFVVSEEMAVWMLSVRAKVFDDEKDVPPSRGLVDRFVG